MAISNREKPFEIQRAASIFQVWTFGESSIKWISSKQLLTPKALRRKRRAEAMRVCKGALFRTVRQLADSFGRLQKNEIFLITMLSIVASKLYQCDLKIMLIILKSYSGKCPWINKFSPNEWNEVWTFTYFQAVLFWKYRFNSSR